MKVNSLTSSSVAQRVDEKELMSKDMEVNSLASSNAAPKVNV